MSIQRQEHKVQLDEEALLKSYKGADKRLFLFDYDGTLTPIVMDPASATPSESLLKTLELLSHNPRNIIWIISGRDQSFLLHHFGDFTNIGLSAEHGSFVRRPGTQNWDNLTQTMDLAWQADIQAIFQRFTDATVGSWIERKNVAITWHYRNVERDFGEAQASKCRRELENTVVCNHDIKVISGKCNVEVRPSDINKGKIIQRLITSAECSDGARYGVQQPFGFIFCLGDDETDEDMFQTLLLCEADQQHIYTCRVGIPSRESFAKTHLPNPDTVIKTLARLATMDDQASRETASFSSAAVDD